MGYPWRGRPLEARAVPRSLSHWSLSYWSLARTRQGKRIFFWFIQHEYDATLRAERQ